MEVNSLIVYEFKKDERIYHFHVPNGAPLGEAYEAAGAFMDCIVKSINEHAERMKPQDPAPCDEECKEECEDEKEEESREEDQEGS